MRSRKIDELYQVKSKDVKPLYTIDEVADKLASAVHYCREGKSNNPEQALELELMYSIIMALKK